MVLKLPWMQKRMFRALFSFLQVFWVIKLKAFSGKVRQNIKSYLNQNLIIRNFLEKFFEANLSSRTNVLSVWKRHFSFFIKFLSDEVELFFWENETKCSSLHKSKFGHMKLFRKWFWGYLELKTNVLSVWKEHFSVFCIFLIEEVETFFWEIETMLWKLFHKVCFVGNFLENAFQSWFDDFRQLLLEFLNISNVLNVTIWIFNWS